MKKVEKVSIAEIAFTLDEDACVVLRGYLDHLHEYYDNDPDGPEIITDIEGRIAELILSEQVYIKVVSRHLVEGIILQLGTPEEIEADGDPDAVSGSESSENSDGGSDSGSDGSRVGRGPRAQSPPEATIPRRLHRSAEGKILGGVCSGIARFWDINPSLVRLAFILPVLMGVLVLPWNSWWRMREMFFESEWVLFVLYIVLWIVLPMARTPRQRLESRGEKVTPASIRQNLQEGASTPAGRKAASVAAELVNVLGRVVLFFVKFAMAVAGFAMMLAAMAMFIAMIAVLVNPDAVVIDNNPLNLRSVFEGMSVVSPGVFAALAVFVAMMPVMIVGMAMLGFTFSWRLGRAFYAVTLGVWALAMIFLGIVCVSNINFFRDYVHYRIERWYDDGRHDGDRDAIFHDGRQLRRLRDGRRWGTFDAESGKWVDADDDEVDEVDQTVEQRGGEHDGHRRRVEIRVPTGNDNAGTGSSEPSSAGGSSSVSSAGGSSPTPSAGSPSAPGADSLGGGQR